MNREGLIAVLESYNSTLLSADDRQKTEAALQSFQDSGDAAVIVQSVYIDPSVSMANRVLALILLRNTIGTMWRRTGPSALTNEFVVDSDKQIIRQRMLEPSVVNCTESRLARLNASLVAQVARVDFPQRWPCLLDELIQQLKTQVANRNYTAIENLLLICIQVIKGLGRAKFGRAKAGLETAAANLLNAASETHYILQIDPGLLSPNLLYISLKFLVVVLSLAYLHPHRDEAATQVILNVGREMSEGVKSLTPPNASMSETELTYRLKYTRQCGKLLCKIYETNPCATVLLFAQSGLFEVYTTVLDLLQSDTTDETWQNMAIQGLSLIQKLVRLNTKGIRVREFKLRTEQDKQDSARAEEVLSILFSQANVVQLCRLVVNRVMVLTSNDLVTWQSEPEQFYLNEIEATGSDLHLRPLGSKLFSDLAVNFSELVRPEILSFLDYSLYNRDMPDTITLSEARKVDLALYTLERGMPALYNQVDFDNVLETVVLKLAAVQSCTNDDSPTPLAIIRARLCRVVSEWVGTKCSPAHRTTLFEMIVSMLQSSPHNDIVVQLFAVLALRATVDDYNFSVESLDPWFPQILDSVLKLVTPDSPIESMECRLEVWKTIRVLIDRTGLQMRPYTGRLTDALATTVNSPSYSIALAPTVLPIVKSLVEACQDQNTNTIAMLLIYSELSRQPQFEATIVEECLPLWRAVMSYTADGPLGHNSPMLQCFTDFMPLLLVGHSEHLPQLLMLVDAYLRLHWQAIASSLPPLLSKLAEFVPHMKLEYVSMVCDTIVILMLVSSSEEYGSLLVETGLFKELFVMALDNDSSGVTFLVKTRIFSVFSRLALANARALVQLVGQNQMAPFLESWFDSLDTIGAPFEQKLHVFGLSALCEADSLPRSWTETLVKIMTDLVESELLEPQGPEYQDADDQDSTPDDSRRVQLERQDPVHAIHLGPLLEATRKRLQVN